MTEPRTINLSFEDAVSEAVEVIEIAPGRFRLGWTPMLADPPLYLGDIIEAQADEKGVYRFQRLVKRSGLHNYCWCLSRQVMESEAMGAFKAIIEQSGGCWEQIAGGFLVVHLHEDAPLDAERELDTVIAQVKVQPADS